MPHNTKGNQSAGSNEPRKEGDSIKIFDESLPLNSRILEYERSVQMSQQKEVQGKNKFFPSGPRR